MSHVGVCRPSSFFGLKKGIDFAHFDLESGMVFEGTINYGMNEFIVSIPNE